MRRDGRAANEAALTREIVAGVSILAVTAIAVAVFVPPADLAGRVLVTAVVTGVLAAVFSDWRARTVVAAMSVFLVVVVLGRGAEVHMAAGSPWPYTPLIGLAVLLGVGHRRITRARSRPNGWDGGPDEPSSDL